MPATERIIIEGLSDETKAMLAAALNHLEDVRPGRSATRAAPPHKQLGIFSARDSIIALIGNKADGISYSDPSGFPDATSAAMAAGYILGSLGASDHPINMALATALEKTVGDMGGPAPYERIRRKARKEIHVACNAAGIGPFLACDTVPVGHHNGRHR